MRCYCCNKPDAEYKDTKENKFYCAECAEWIDIQTRKDEEDESTLEWADS